MKFRIFPYVAIFSFYGLFEKEQFQTIDIKSKRFENLGTKVVVLTYFVYFTSNALLDIILDDVFNYLCIYVKGATSLTGDEKNRGFLLISKYLFQYRHFKKTIANTT